MSEYVFTLTVEIEDTYQNKEASELNLKSIKDAFKKRICQACEASEDMASVHLVSLEEED